jgi:Fe-S oxidoreductase
MVNNILACTTCERCDEVCSIALPIEPSWLKLRGQLIEDEGRMTFPPFEMMAASLEAEGGIWAGYRKDRANWFPEELWEEHGPQNESSNVYFAGCTASYVETDIGESAVHLLDEAGVDFTYLGEEENCCATPMLIAGKWELFVETMKANIEAVKEAGGDTVITSCPACDMMWRKVYPEWAEKLGFDYDIEARNYSEVVAKRIAAGDLEFPDTEGEPVTVTIHDSCHIGRASGVYDAPREMAEAVPNTELVEMAHNRDEALCCGSVLTLIHEPDVAADLGAVRLEEAIEAGADKVLALCPCCQFQFKVSRAEKELPIEIQDLAHYAAEALGHEIPVPDEDVMYQWSAFEAMIALMTPEGFAALMCDMWPELIDAMPFGMGRMMRAIGRMGSVGDTLFGLMKPMFPLLFPRLLPMMMPRVMPTMLEKVEERIDMPDYMQEQLPTLMPQVMDNLMPHMIDDVVPLVTEPMIDYLQNPEPVAASDETLAG